MSGPSDAYGRIAYSGLIAWPERLQREGPLLARVLGRAPVPRLLDLGCGSGEHSRFLAAQGFQVTGVDASADQLQAARSADPGGRYVQASLTALTGQVDAGRIEGGQGGAVCLGNTLPHLQEEGDVLAFFRGLWTCLAPGAPFLLQVLNYDRILDRGDRVFPPVLRPGAAPGEDTVFLRFMTHHGEGRITFTPATLRLRPGAEPPLELVASHDVRLRGWRRAQVESLLAEAGLQVREVFGTMTGEPWTAQSSDLVVVAERT